MSLESKAAPADRLPSGPESPPADTPAHVTIPRDRPPLVLNRSYWGLLATQFLGAFNDNVFKQIVLLLSVWQVLQPDGTFLTVDEQGKAQFIFALPFVLFSGFGGYLADRYSKRSIIVICKFAEVGIMLFGVAAFALFGVTGLPGVLVVLFLMGTHSAFFGPSKYGILPEMLRARDLPVANGTIQMTTFFAIILGTAIAGILKMRLGTEYLWVASLACMGIAAFGTLVSLNIRPLPASHPGLPLDLSSLTVPSDTWRLLRRERPLRHTLWASCMFWMVAGLVLPGVNALGKLQLALNEDWTSGLVAVITIGIAFGCAISGILSRGKVSGKIVLCGAWGTVGCLLLLALPGAGSPHLLGFYGSIPALIGLGFFAGMFVVPLQVYLQSRPPEGQKGRMVATMNLFNWIAICLSAVLYEALSWLQAKIHWPPSAVFAFTAILMLPVALFYRPANESLEAGD